MKKLQQHEFTLVLGGVDDLSEGLDDQLYNAGCDDALINFRNGTVYIDFNREDASIEEAVITAIKQIESIPARARVISILPDDFVSESEIARRLNQNKQTVSLWVKRERRQKLPFPNPILKLSEKSPLWRWHEVINWLHQQELLQDKSLVESAKFISHINAVLGERDPHIKKYRHDILNRLS